MLNSSMLKNVQVQPPVQVEPNPSINSTTLEEEFETGSKSAYFALLINVRQLPNETTISVTSHRNKLLFLNRKGVLKEVFLPTMKY